MRALVVLVLLASTAYADPIARVRSSFHGRVVKSSLVEQTTERIVWTFTVTTSSEASRELVLPVSMDTNAWIATMSVEIGGETLDAATLPIDEARERYEAIAGRLVDPALLEFVATKRGRDEFQLRVFPVSKSVPATITIELWVPSEPVVTRAGAVTKAMSLVAVPANPLHVANRNIDRGSPTAAPTFFGPTTMSNEERFVIR